MQKLVFLFCFLSIPGNAEYKEENYNRIRGEDRWLGRTVRKNFAGFGIFKGKIDAVDEDEDVPGHRIFHVVWEDGDDAWIAVDELVDILQRTDDDSVTVCAACVTACA